MVPLRLKYKLFHQDWNMNIWSAEVSWPKTSNKIFKISRTDEVHVPYDHIRRRHNFWGKTNSTKLILSAAQLRISPSNNWTPLKISWPKIWRQKITHFSRTCKNLFQIGENFIPHKTQLNSTKLIETRTWTNVFVFVISCVIYLCHCIRHHCLRKSSSNNWMTLKAVQFGQMHITIS